MLRVNDQEWEIEVNGFQVGKQFGSLRTALQNFRDHKRNAFYRRSINQRVLRDFYHRYIMNAEKSQWFMEKGQACTRQNFETSSSIFCYTGNYY